MRGAVLSSSIAHIVLLAITARPGAHAPLAASATVALHDPPVRASEPIEVVFVTLPDSSSPGGHTSTGRHQRSPAGFAAAASAPTRANELRQPDGRDDHWMRMRSALDASDIVGRIADAGTPSPSPVPAEPTGKVHDVGGGRAVIHDRVTTVDVEPDGAAHFHDKADADIHVSAPLPTPTALRGALRRAGRVITKWAEDPYASTRVGPARDLPPHLQAVPGVCDDVTNSMCDATAATAEEDGDTPLIFVPLPVAKVFGKLDITAWAMRKAGIDPYASRKHKLLDTTREERAARGARYRAEQLKRSPELMQRNLEMLWRATADASLRRQGLFQLWDECDEDEGPSGEAGTRTRALVIGWIRSHLPAESADGFSAAEIATLNERRISKQPFEPY